MQSAVQQWFESILNLKQIWSHSPQKAQETSIALQVHGRWNIMQPWSTLINHDEAFWHFLILHKFLQDSSTTLRSQESLPFCHALSLAPSPRQRCCSPSTIAEVIRSQFLSSASSASSASIASSVFLVPLSPVSQPVQFIIPFTIQPKCKQCTEQILFFASFCHNLRFCLCGKALKSESKGRFSLTILLTWRVQCFLKFLPTFNTWRSHSVLTLLLLRFWVTNTSQYGFGL